MAMSVRLMRPGETSEVVKMMRVLWPDVRDYDFNCETVYLWQRPDGSLGGFASFSLRPWAEGCDSAPVPYIEGWWVAPDLRQQGVGRELVAAIELWCREQGYTEVGSDAETANAVSIQAHGALGFEPTLQLQFFRKRLS
ncbi:MAG: GNAT family N-acetyltransferase [Acidobacteriota bacterium]